MSESGIIDTSGQQISSKETEVPMWLRPGAYVILKGSLRGGNQVHGQDVMMIMDPGWLAMPAIEGMVFILFAMPYYHREGENAEGRVPLMMPMVDPKSSRALDSLTPDEQKFIAEGNMLQDPRITYQLTVINPRPFAVDPDTLLPVGPNVFVVLDPTVSRANLPVETRWQYREAGKSGLKTPEPSNETVK